MIRDFYPHTLRHTFATRYFENKMEPKVVQTLLGHSSISSTLNIHTHVLDSLYEENGTDYKKSVSFPDGKKFTCFELPKIRSAGC